MSTGQDVILGFPDGMASCTLVGVGHIRRNLGLLFSSIQPPMYPFRARDSFQRIKDKECILEASPVDALPVVIRPFMFLL
jgi:hypothetical protein